MPALNGNKIDLIQGVLVFGRVFAAAVAVMALMLLPAVASTAEPDLVEMAEMSDGVGLSTALHLPDPGVYPPPWPSVLIRTPYPDILGQVDPSIADMIIYYMVDLLGVALVVQDTRGTGGSGGEADAFFSEHSDGPRTVEWLASQDWSDGQVFQFGLSALAIPGYLAAPDSPDALKCQFLGEAAPDMYSMAAFHGGVFKKNTVESWVSWVGAQAMLSKLSDHRNCDGFWDPLILDRLPGDIHAAAMHIGGWYDVFTEGTIAGYRAYVDRGDEWARDNQYLVIGPWDHWSLAEALGKTEADGYAMQSDMLAFVSFCLAGDDSIVNKWPHVRYYVMGSTEEGAPGNEWRDSPDWPLPTWHAEFPVRSDGSLGNPFETTVDEDGVPADSDAFEQDDVLPAILPFSHSSTSPVVGGRNLVGSSGRRELSKVLERNDYVMFQTDPLDEPFESIGRMSMSLDVSTRWPDADVVVRLADVYPDGSTWLISDGAARLSRREGCEAASEVVPGQIYTIDVDLLTSAMVFDRGHRLAVIVTTTMYAKYELNPELEAVSRSSGPISDAVTIHGGRLMMPVASEIVFPPEVVEEASATEVVEVSPDVVETVDVVEETVSDVAADVYEDVPVAADSAADDSSLAGDLPDGDVVVDRGGDPVGDISLEIRPGADASDGDASSYSGPGGCSAAPGRAGSFGLVMLLAFIALLLSRRSMVPVHRSRRPGS